MKLLIFAVRDRATDQFANPMFLFSSGQAIRGFADELNRKEANNYLNMHPEDYDLFSLGSFDTDTGLFDVGVPKQLAVGKDLIVKT